MSSFFDIFEAFGLFRFLSFLRKGGGKCPRCGVKMQRLPKPNPERVHRCPSCEGLWALEHLKWQPFTSKPE